MLINYHPTVKHMHGGMGKMVFKSREGQDIVAAKPDSVKQPNTPAQQEQKELFRKGVLYAKAVLADPVAVLPYEAKAKQLHKPVFALAVGDYLNPPVVDEVNVTGYHKHVGDAILIRAHDDIAVTGVTVSIVDNTQTAVESGAATYDAVSGTWKYVATKDASAKTSLTVTATALDLPGHAGTLSASA